MYFSGSPDNDAWQARENGLCEHRLFSLHGNYFPAVMQWVQDLRRGIVTTSDRLRAYPALRENLRLLDRATNADGCLEDTLCTDDTPRIPRTVMLDSGAYTAWKSGTPATVDDVLRTYTAFIDAAGDLFDEIWMINLDCIPGTFGETPSAHEIAAAQKIGDENLRTLTERFGDRILPVYHQGESMQQLAACVDTAPDYLCLSPRQGLHESQRLPWCSRIHSILRARWPHIRTHGLATTANRMMRDVPWYSVDSAAWRKHAAYGMVDILVDGPRPRYTTAFLSRHGMRYDLTATVIADGATVSGTALGLTASSTADEVHAAFAAAGIAAADIPLFGGTLGRGKHYDDRPACAQESIRDAIATVGLSLATCRHSSRGRSLVNMTTFARFAAACRGLVPTPAHATLFTRAP